MAVKIASVDQGSAAEQAGIVAGSVLLSADGNPINDMLDYQFYTANPKMELAVSIGGELQYLTIEKQEYEPLGCNLKAILLTSTTLAKTIVCSVLLTRCQRECESLCILRMMTKGSAFCLATMLP